MARNIEQATAVVNLDGKNAAQQLRELEIRAKEARKELIELGKSNDKAGWDKKAKEIKEINKEMKMLKAESFDVSRVLKNLNGTNLNDLEKAQRQITAELKKMSRGTDEYVQKSKQLGLVKSEVGKVKAEMNLLSDTQGNFFTRAFAGFKQYIGVAAGAVAAITGIAYFLKKNTDAFMEFEKSVDELESITGLAGDDMNWLKQQALDLSTAVLDGGVKVTASAQDIVKAFALVGSKKPELLANKEALAAMTKEAIILSEASGLTLPASVEALTGAMNQFNAPASEARFYIDALAAGAKYGSAAIPQSTEALLKFGAAANSSNVPISESVALIQLLADKGLEGADAGTALRNILLTLSNAPGLPRKALDAFKEAGIDIGILTNKSLPLEVRLRETSKLLNTQTGLLDVFGKENVIAAQNIFQNLDRYHQLADQIQEVGVAQQQATINTANSTSELKQAQNQAQKNAIVLGQKLAPAYIQLINFGNDLMKSIIKLVEWGQRNARTVEFVAKAIVIATVAVVSYSTAQKLAALWTARNTEGALLNIVATKAKAAADMAGALATQLFAAAQMLLTGNIKGAAQAMRIFSATLATNPIGLFAAAIAVAVTAFVLFNKEGNKLKDWQKDMASAAARGASELASETNKVNALFDALKKTNPQSQERARLIQVMNDKYGLHLQNLKDEKMFLDQINKAQQNVIDGIKQKIEIQVREEQLLTLTKKQFELNEKIAQQEKFAKEAIRLGVATSSGAVQGPLELIRGYRMELSEIEREINAKSKNIAEITQKLTTTNSSDVNLTTPEITPTEGDKGPKKNTTLDELMKALEKVRELNQQTSSELLTLQEEEIIAVENKYRKEIELASKYENDRTEEGKQWGLIRLEYERHIEKEKQKVNEKFAELQKVEKERQAEEERMRGVQEYKDYLDLLQQKYEARKRLGLISLQQQEDEEIFNLIKDFDAGYIESLEEFEMLKAQIHAKYADQRAAKEKEVQEKMLSEVQKSFQVQQQFTSAFSNLVSTLKDKELADAGDNERKKKEIAKKYAIPEFLIKMSSIVANTAVAIMQGFAQLGPIAGGVMAAILGVTGGVQLGIAADELTKVQGYEAGYYPVLDQKDRKYNAKYLGKSRTGIVKNPSLFLAGEGNMPEMIVDGPTMRNLNMNFPGALDAIEYARQGARGIGNGSNNVDTGRSFKSKSGGDQNSSGYSSDIGPYLLAVASSLNQLNKHLKDGIKSKVVYQEIQDVTDNLDIINETFKNVP